jgi:hypothetical protein
VLARAIQLGVNDGAFGLIAADGEMLIPDSLKFKEDITIDGITFDYETFLVKPEICEGIITEQEPDIQPKPITGTYTGTDSGVLPGSEPGPEPGPQPQTVTGYHHVRLLVEGIPASKIADVNRGILLPFSRSIGDFTFTIEIDVNTEDGISPTVLENQIKETIRQIGGRIVEEELE